jgi:hypothetical protein
VAFYLHRRISRPSSPPPFSAFSTTALVPTTSTMQDPPRSCTSALFALSTPYTEEHDRDVARAQVTEGYEAVCTAANKSDVWRMQLVIVGNNGHEHRRRRLEKLDRSMKVTAPGFHSGWWAELNRAGTKERSSLSNKLFLLSHTVSRCLPLMNSSPRRLCFAVLSYFSLSVLQPYALNNVRESFCHSPERMLAQTEFVQELSNTAS